MNYLLSTETADGGWFYAGDGEYGEVNGEVLSALAPLVRDGDEDRDRGHEAERPKDHNERDGRERARPHRGHDR